jgi:hypothetical protein
MDGRALVFMGITKLGQLRADPQAQANVGLRSLKANRGALEGYL